MLLPHLCNKKHWELLYFNHLVSCRSQIVHIFSTGGHHRGHFITLSCIKGHPSEHCTMFYLRQRHPNMGGTRGQCPPPPPPLPSLSLPLLQCIDFWNKVIFQSTNHFTTLPLLTLKTSRIWSKFVWSQSHILALDLMKCIIGYRLYDVSHGLNHI